jgi:GDP-4-dehydro-6-deoxy-D-mannose reductase
LLTTVLVTGPNGFVGRHLRETLGDAFTPLEADVLDVGALTAATREAQPNAVVHLAAESSVVGSWDGVARTWSVNAVGTANVLEAVRAESAAARVLVPSTGDVYGKAEVTPTPEDSPVRPLSPYAASKAAAELACAQAATTGLDVVVARAFPHTGPGQDERFAVGSWACQIARLEAKGGGSLRVGDLTPERDLLDVRDVCQAYELLLDRSVPAGTYNIATGSPVAMRDVVEVLVRNANAPVRVEQDKARLRPVDVPRLSGDASLLRAATGWEPRIPLEQTLADTLEAARQSELERVS